MAVYCPNCGKKLPDYAEFCDNCGTKIPLMNTPQFSSPAKTPEKKNFSVLWKIVKWFFILNVVAGIFLLLIGGLESIFHRTPPADPPAQQTVNNNTGSGTEKPSTVKPTGNQTSSGNQTPVEQQTHTESTPVPAVPEVQTPVVEDIPQGLGDLTNVWFDDFLFYEDDVYNNGIPKGAVLREAGYIGGEWKYCMTFNRTIPGEERIDEIGTAEVSFSEQGAQLILHPQYIRYGNDVMPETEEEVGYEPFSGTWDPEYIDLSDGGIAIGLGPYYSYEGRDYVLGNIVVRESGMFGDVLLVRP
ncbi:MAG: zinc ribbon domain-containing protein [Solobacterium sp.]|nr:zinc ribbon domain-containing protein [Solobacterium sp.]